MDGQPPSPGTLMERLLSLLKALEESDVVPRKFLKSHTHESVSEIDSLMDLLCIDEEGCVRVDVVQQLTKLGYAVYPIERDRFGWVLGAIETKKGSIMFG